jgi:hypothetical protein
MAKARKKHRAVKRPRKVNPALPSAEEVTLKLAEEAAAAFKKRAPDFQRRIEATAERIRALLIPSQVELAERAQLAEARETIRRHLAIRDGLVAPPWAKVPASSKNTGNRGWKKRAVKKLLLTHYTVDDLERLGSGMLFKRIGNEFEQLFPKSTIGRGVVSTARLEILSEHK